MGNRRLTLKDSRGIEHAFVYWRGPREPVADLTPAPEEGLGLKTWEQAVGDVKRCGIPLCNLEVDRGWNSDYGLPWVDKEGYPLHAEIDGVPDDVWVERHGWRVFAEVDTGAGLAFTEEGESFSLSREQADRLQQSGWQYVGSAAYRTEVIPDSLPEEQRQRLQNRKRQLESI